MSWRDYRGIIVRINNESEIIMVKETLEEKPVNQ